MAGRRCIIMGYDVPEMKLLSLIVLLTFACDAGAQQDVLRVPAFTAYLDPNPRGASVSERGGITRWRDPGLSVLWFGEFKATGDLECSVVLKPPAGASTSLRLTVGGQSHDGVAKSQGAGMATVDFGTYKLPDAGYVRFTLESLNPAGQAIGDVDALVLKGPAVTGAHFNLKPRRNAASVHLHFPIPADTKVAAFYSEVTGVDDPPGTYYMACGWHRGYFGMQVNGPTERRIIFSVWDSGNEATSRNKVAAADRVVLVDKGEGVVAGDFGNEGTGGHSHLVYPWKSGEPQRFVVTAQPSDATHTVFTGYYFHPGKKKWALISSWRAPREGGYLRGLYSFSEDFDGATGHLRRKAMYGNQWARDAQGKWTELTAATFTFDATGKADRLDRFAGVEKGQFFLSHGGFVPGYAEGGTRFVRPASPAAPQDVPLPGAAR